MHRVASRLRVPVPYLPNMPQLKKPRALAADDQAPPAKHPQPVAIVQESSHCQFAIADCRFGAIASCSALSLDRSLSHILRNSQALAARQSLRTVITDIPRVVAVSSRLSPPK